MIGLGNLDFFLTNLSFSLSLLHLCIKSIDLLKGLSSSLFYLTANKLYIYFNTQCNKYLNLYLFVKLLTLLSFNHPPKNLKK